MSSVAHLYLEAAEFLEASFHSLESGLERPQLQSLVIDLLDAMRVRYRTQQPSPPLSTSTVSEIGQAITYPIDCW